MPLNNKPLVRRILYKIAVQNERGKSMNQKSREILFGSIRWLMIAMASTMVLLFIAAFFFWKTEISERYLQLFAFISCGIGSLIVGFGGGRIIQKRGMICGVVYGSCYLFLMLILLSFICGYGIFSNIIQPKWLLCLLISAVSGTFSVNLRKE